METFPKTRWLEVVVQNPDFLYDLVHALEMLEQTKEDLGDMDLGKLTQVIRRLLALEVAKGHLVGSLMSGFPGEAPEPIKVYLEKLGYLKRENLQVYLWDSWDQLGKHGEHSVYIDTVYYGPDVYYG